MKNQELLHICYIITRGDWGGAQRYVSDLVRSFSNNAKITVIVGGNGTDDLSREIIQWGNGAVNIIHIPSLGREIHPIGDWTAFVALTKALKTLNPDIIHLNSTKVGVLGSLGAQVVPRAKVVYTVHGWVTNEPMTSIKRYLYTIAERYTKRQKDAYIVLSKSEQYVGIHSLGIPSTKLHVIPNGIEPTIPPPEHMHEPMLREMQQAQKKGKTVFLTIANLYETKGVDILIDAISHLAKEDYHLFIAGSGPLELHIKKQITMNKLDDSITLLGSVPNASVLCSAANYLVIPSRKEGLPYVLIEALRTGTPIIATSVGAIEEVLAYANGYTLVPPEDRTALTHALTHAVQTKESIKPILPQLYTYEAMMQATWSLYQSLLES